MSDLNAAQRAALADAHLSLNHGGLEEVAGAHGTVWVGAHPEATVEHNDLVVASLHYRGLIERIGQKPMRSAHITEEGLLELDIAGVAA